MSSQSKDLKYPDKVDLIDAYENFFVTSRRYDSDFDINIFTGELVKLKNIQDFEDDKIGESIDKSAEKFDENDDDHFDDYDKNGENNKKNEYFANERADIDTNTNYPKVGEEESIYLKQLKQKMTFKTMMNDNQYVKKVYKLRSDYIRDEGVNDGIKALIHKAITSVSGSETIKKTKSLKLDANPFARCIPSAQLLEMSHSLGMPIVLNTLELAPTNGSRAYTENLLAENFDVNQVSSIGKYNLSTIDDVCFGLPGLIKYLNVEGLLAVRKVVDFIANIPRTMLSEKNYKIYELLSVLSPTIFHQSFSEGILRELKMASNIVVEGPQFEKGINLCIKQIMIELSSAEKYPDTVFPKVSIQKDGLDAYETWTVHEFTQRRTAFMNSMKEAIADRKIVFIDFLIFYPSIDSHNAGLVFFSKYYSFHHRSSDSGPYDSREALPFMSALSGAFFEKEHAEKYFDIYMNDNKPLNEIADTWLQHTRRLTLQHHQKCHHLDLFKTALPLILYDKQTFILHDMKNMLVGVVAHYENLETHCNSILTLGNMILAVIDRHMRFQQKKNRKLKEGEIQREDHVKPMELQDLLDIVQKTISLLDKMFILMFSDIINIPNTKLMNSEYRYFEKKIYYLFFEKIDQANKSLKHPKLPPNSSLHSKDQYLKDVRNFQSLLNDTLVELKTIFYFLQLVMAWHLRRALHNNEESVLNLVKELNIGRTQDEELGKKKCYGMNSYNAKWARILNEIDSVKDYEVKKEEKKKGGFSLFNRKREDATLKVKQSHHDDFPGGEVEEALWYIGRTTVKSFHINLNQMEPHSILDGYSIPAVCNVEGPFLVYLVESGYMDTIETYISDLLTRPFYGNPFTHLVALLHRGGVTLQLHYLSDEEIIEDVKGDQKYLNSECIEKNSSKKTGGVSESARYRMYVLFLDTYPTFSISSKIIYSEKEAIYGTKEALYFCNALSATKCLVLLKLPLSSIEDFDNKEDLKGNLSCEIILGLRGNGCYTQILTAFSQPSYLEFDLIFHFKYRSSLYEKQVPKTFAELVIQKCLDLNSSSHLLVTLAVGGDAYNWGKGGRKFNIDFIKLKTNREHLIAELRKSTYDPIALSFIYKYQNEDKSFAYLPAIIRFMPIAILAEDHQLLHCPGIIFDNVFLDVKESVKSLFETWINFDRARSKNASTRYLNNGSTSKRKRSILDQYRLQQEKLVYQSCLEGDFFSAYIYFYRFALVKLDEQAFKKLIPSIVRMTRSIATGFDMIYRYSQVLEVIHSKKDLSEADVTKESREMVYFQLLEFSKYVKWCISSQQLNSLRGLCQQVYLDLKNVEALREQIYKKIIPVSGLKANPEENLGSYLKEIRKKVYYLKLAVAKDIHESQEDVKEYIDDIFVNNHRRFTQAL